MARLSWLFVLGALVTCAALAAEAPAADPRPALLRSLDGFRARFSIPHGVGGLGGNTIEFTVPCADGPFRDTFVFSPDRGTWELRIDSGRADGSWAHFARYELRRR